MKPSDLTKALGDDLARLIAVESGAYSRGYWRRAKHKDSEMSTHKKATILKHMHVLEHLIRIIRKYNK